MTGRIYKGIGGFYSVKAADGLFYECKARGIFRKRGIKPLAGDLVTIAVEPDSCTIDEIEPRKNAFVRPPVANVDILFVVAGTTEPTPSTLVIDKLTAVAVDSGVQPVLLVTKTDLASPDALLQSYATAGFPAFVVSAESGEGLPRLREMLAGKLGVFAGNTGVGKSTLLNALLPGAARETGEISKKLGRGRHTTREVELFELGGGLIADTPGFASYDVQAAGTISADNMQFAFPEIADRMPDCRFSGCTHLGEPGCTVLEALEAGEISQSRFASYKELYRAAKESEGEWR